MNNELNIALESELSAAEAAETAGGLLVSRSGSGRISSVTTDSRQAETGTLFVALRGENTDGHKYIASAFECGASCAICEYDPFEGIDAPKGDLIIVPDALAALGKLGRQRKREVGPLTVAVTGSVGKTTTKELTASVLGTRFETCKTSGNFNSEIGLPLVLLGLKRSHRAAVLEMGMSARGEIERLSRIAEPDLAIITNIGSCHIEYLGSREGIRDAKLEILAGLKSGGRLITDGDEPLLAGIPNAVYVSRKGKGDVKLSNVRVDLGSDTPSTRFDLDVGGEALRELLIPAAGEHNALDAAYACVAGSLCGLRETELRAGLANFRNTGMRQNIYKLGRVRVIEDCYNASPEAVAASLAVLAGLAEKRGGRVVAVLGEMRELGVHSERLHYETGLRAAERGVGLLFAFGAGAEPIIRGARDGGLPVSRTAFFPDLDAPEALGEALVRGLAEDDTVLFKASRAVRLERVIEYLKNRGTDI